MNFQNLEYFMAAATEKSFSRAADKLYITQQTMSGQIAALENELGCTLFLRKKPLQLTREGEIFSAYAVSLLSEYHRMLAELKSLSVSVTRILRIGISYSTAFNHLKGAVDDFRQIYPAIQFQFEVLPGDVIMARLRDGSLDFAVTHFPDRDPAFVSYELFEEQIVLMATRELFENAFGDAADHVIGEIRESGRYSLLKRCPYAKYTRPNVVNRFASRFIEESIQTPTVYLEADSLEILLNICRNAPAYSFFPKNITSELIENSELAPFILFDLGASSRFMMHYGYLKDSPHVRALEAFIAFAEKRRRIIQHPDLYDHP